MLDEMDDQINIRIDSPNLSKLENAELIIKEK